MKITDALNWQGLRMLQRKNEPLAQLADKSISNGPGSNYIDDIQRRQTEVSTLIGATSARDISLVRFFNL